VVVAVGHRSQLPIGNLRCKGLSVRTPIDRSRSHHYPFPRPRAFSLMVASLVASLWV